MHCRTDNARIVIIHVRRDTALDGPSNPRLVTSVSCSRRQDKHDQVGVIANIGKGATETGQCDCFCCLCNVIDIDAIDIHIDCNVHYILCRWFDAKLTVGTGIVLPFEGEGVLKNVALEFRRGKLWPRVAAFNANDQ